MDYIRSLGVPEGGKGCFLCQAAAAESDPEKAKQAPYTTPVRRLDEVKATRKPVVRQPLD